MGDAEEIYRRNKIALLRQAFSAVEEDNVPCQIDEGVYLGSLGAAFNKDRLLVLNVTHILTVGCALKPAYPNDFVYKKIDVTDRSDTDLAQHFDECFDFIDEVKKMGGGVLVHCFAGRSRSVTIIVAYLMKKQQMSLPQALGYVKTKRPHAAPNTGFLLQLQNFETSIQGMESVGKTTTSSSDTKLESEEILES